MKTPDSIVFAFFAVAVGAGMGAAPTDSPPLIPPQVEADPGRPPVALSINPQEPTCPLAAGPEVAVACPGWEARTCRGRNAVGAVIRRSDIKREFLSRYGFKGTARKGWVLDHLFPLACGGCDVPWNLQMQPVAEGKQKDRWERDVCGARGTANDKE